MQHYCPCIMDVTNDNQKIRMQSQFTCSSTMAFDNKTSQLHNQYSWQGRVFFTSKDHEFTKSWWMCILMQSPMKTLRISCRSLVFNHSRERRKNLSTLSLYMYKGFEKLFLCMLMNFAINSATKLTVILLCLVSKTRLHWKIE